VTTGAAAALVVGMAAIVAGEDAEKLQRLPDTTDMKNEAIIQKCQRNAYDFAIRQSGSGWSRWRTSDRWRPPSMSGRLCCSMWSPSIGTAR